MATREELFKDAMRGAKAQEQTAEAPGDRDYWKWYQTGLRRAYHGPNFGTAEEHQQRSELQDKRGEGYRAGLHAFSKPSAVTRRKLSISFPDKLLDLMDADRKGRESRSQQITRLVMAGLKLSAKEQLAIMSGE